MKALLLVDVQNDFLPGGSLAVPHGDEILPPIAELLELPFDFVIASQDAHPPGHISFASTYHKKAGDRVYDQILWRDHCVEGTEGIKLRLPLDRIDFVVKKGADPKIDSYSAFYDNRRARSTGLAELLRKNGVKRIAIVGLATDFCVLWTVLDALKEGFEVDVIQEGCRGIDLQKGDVTRAFKKMEEAGAHLFSTVTSFRHSLFCKCPNSSSSRSQSDPK